MINRESPPLIQLSILSVSQELRKMLSDLSGIPFENFQPRESIETDSTTQWLRFN